MTILIFSSIAGQGVVGVESASPAFRFLLEVFRSVIGIRSFECFFGGSPLVLGGIPWGLIPRYLLVTLFDSGFYLPGLVALLSLTLLCRILVGGSVQLASHILRLGGSLVFSLRNVTGGDPLFGFQSPSLFLA